MSALLLSSLLYLISFTEYVQTGPYNKTYTESQLQAGGGFILPDFNEEQVGGLKEPENCRKKKLADIFKRCIWVVGFISNLSCIIILKLDTKLLIPGKRRNPIFRALHLPSGSAGKGLL